jgi:hypothetical protein
MSSAFLLGTNFIYQVTSKIEELTFGHATSGKIRLHWCEQLFQRRRPDCLLDKL